MASNWGALIGLDTFTSSSLEHGWSRRGRGEEEEEEEKEEEEEEKKEEVEEKKERTSKISGFRLGGYLYLCLKHERL